MNVEEYKRIIASAIDNEIEAYNFYATAGEKMADTTLKSIFKDLADEEMKHRDFLQSLRNQEKPMSFNEKGDYKISESIDAPALSLRMKPADAIGLAMKKEEEAMHMYAELAKASTDADQKVMFESLSRMEQGHKVKLEGIYNDMAFPEDW